MIVTATPRGRAVGQVLQQFWKQVGANMEIEQVDQATIVPRAFMRQFQLTPWRIVDLADPDPQMYANFRTGSPVALANYSNPELDRLLDRARVTADPDKRIEDYCAISRLINKEAIWFWTFQNTYYAISTAKLKGLPKMYSGVIDVSARLDGIAVACWAFVARRLLYLVPVLIAVSLLTFLIASLLPGDLAYTILGDQATPEKVAALRRDMGLDQPIWWRYLVLARRCAAGRFRPVVPHRADRAAGGDGTAAGVARADAAGADRRADDRRSPGDRLRGAQRRRLRPLHDRQRLRHAVGADIPVRHPADLSVRGRAALAAGDRLRAVRARTRSAICAASCCRR